MAEDPEGFRYPQLDESRCINCGLCHKVCPVENATTKHAIAERTFGGYTKDATVRSQSTSGGAFSAIVEAWCDENYVIFGAVADKLEVLHTYIVDKAMLQSFRKSKYSQSQMGNAYAEAKDFLLAGKKVLFSGTPCQVSGLLNYLHTKRTDTTNLLTVEVVCEGVPSPLYVRKCDEAMQQKYGSPIASLDYRYKNPGKWDFEIMSFVLGKNKHIQIDRWFNPFWSIWLNHLMSRPSCYECPFNTPERVADITLGDLWGVHLYCPELYGHNGGSSLMFGNTPKGREAMTAAEKLMYGHELKFEDALRYQSPMKRHISMNPQREEFMSDLREPKITFRQLNKKWAKKPSLKLLYQKYIWGNRQKVWFWNLKRKIFKL